jgi:TolB-like protein
VVQHSYFECGIRHTTGAGIAARIEATAEAGGIAISRQVHDQVRDKLGFGFEDKGDVPLKNRVRPVHVFTLTVSKTQTMSPTLALPDKPSIAVLPFQNMSGDPEQEYFADGIVEDIITALSRFKSLFVIARNSSFTYKGKTVDIRQVGRELGVRYVMEGSVRKAADRVRITGQLIDAISGGHLWADRFDSALEDVFELQDRVGLRSLTSRALAAARAAKSLPLSLTDTARIPIVRVLASGFRHVCGDYGTSLPRNVRRKTELRDRRSSSTTTKMAPVALQRPRAA